MKNIIIVVVVGAVSFMGELAHAASWKIVASDGVNKVAAPAHSTRTGTTWFSGIDFQGTYVQASNGRIYWAPADTSLSSSEPSHRSGSVTYGDGVTWVLVGRGRKNIEITLHTTGDLYVHRSNGPASKTGTLLTGKGSSISYPGYSGEINVMSDGGAVTFGVQEY